MLLHAVLAPGESVRVTVEYMQPLHYDTDTNNLVLQLPTLVQVCPCSAATCTRVREHSYQKHIAISGGSRHMHESRRHAHVIPGDRCVPQQASSHVRAAGC